MAEYLASIFGTEKDKVNCSFYFKIGACRHGDRCSRLHNKPTFSQTIVLLNLYRNPQNTAQTADGSHCHVSDVEVQEHYDNFFEEVFTELQEKYGEIEEMNVCDNLGDHLVGNVYVKGMYPRWLLQLHAPATHIPEPPAAALWAGTQAQITPEVPYWPPSPRKEPSTFPRPPAWPLLRLRPPCPSPLSGTDVSGKDTPQTPLLSSPIFSRLQVPLNNLYNKDFLYYASLNKV
ncbi:splicing factor U2AF 26 kDa subunit isoform X1 [Sciurus carolinensis]|uniref:splicing factor U2AF 26 kDa subunit isoform X1 n=1 Tax=Sciurus carolinensis TaxID=30640 RepID=UPI001FB1FAE2|nr:splicing factor U2AF 26 kDa subunit isoform X1 [Sciurus carolinensis]